MKALGKLLLAAQLTCAGVSRAAEQAAGERVSLKSSGGELTVALVGARIVSYRPTGKDEVFFTPQKLDVREPGWQHGGIPVCWPWFSDNNGPDSPCHGFARTSLFEIRERKEDGRSAVLVLGLKSSAATMRQWPYRFDLEYRIELSDVLELTLTTRNLDEKAMKITCGLHPYFRLGERDRARIAGTDGCLYCDAINVLGPDRNESAFRDRCLGDLSLTRPYDHVFTLSPVDYEIVDPVLKRRIAVRSAGTKKLVVWNPGSKPAFDLLNLADDDWRRFVCAEPVTTFRDQAWTLRAGESHVMKVTVSVHPD